MHEGLADKPGRAYLRRSYTDVMTALCEDFLPESEQERREGVPASTRPDVYAPAPPGARKPCGLEIELAKLPAPQPGQDPASEAIRIRGPIPMHAITVNTPDRATLMTLSQACGVVGNARYPWSAGIDTRAANEDPAIADTPPTDPGPPRPAHYDRLRGAVEGAEYRALMETAAPKLDPATDARHLAEMLEADGGAGGEGERIWNAAVEVLLDDEKNGAGPTELTGHIARRAAELGLDAESAERWRSDTAGILKAEKRLEFRNPTGGQPGLAVAIAVVREYPEHMHVDEMRTDRGEPSDAVCQHARVIAGLRAGYTAMAKTDNFGQETAERRSRTAWNLARDLERRLDRNRQPAPAPERPPRGTPRPAPNDGRGLNR